MDCLVLKDVLNTACNITSATYKEVGGLMMPVDTADKVVCTVDQTNGYSSLEITTRQADVEWNSLGPQTTLLRTPVAPQGLFWSAWLDRISKKPSVKVDLIYSSFVSVWTVLECGYYNKQ